MGGLFIVLIAASFAIWAMVAVSSSDLTRQQKSLWFLIVILVPVIGPIIYWRYRTKR